VKGEDAYIAVEKNVAGSRPKELFEDVLEEAEARFEKDRTVLKVRFPMIKPCTLDFAAHDGLFPGACPSSAAGTVAVGGPACLRVLNFPLSLRTAAIADGACSCTSRACGSCILCPCRALMS